MLRVDSENTLRAGKENALIVSEAVFKEIIQISKEYDLEMELRRARRELEETKARLEREKQVALAVAAAAMAQAKTNQSIYMGSGVGSSLATPSYGLGSPAHRAAGSLYYLANQARFMMQAVPGYDPNPLQQTAMRFFP